MSQSTMYLSRARLREDLPAAALRSLLVPAGEADRAGAAHRLVWTLFADTSERERDFLWRETAPGSFYLLSRRRPEDAHGLFDLDPPRVFAPAFAPGDRLRFVLRANATIARSGAPDAEGRRPRGKPCDVVMDALHALPPGVDRARARAGAVAAAGRRWLEDQGGRRGFALATDANREGEWGRVRIVSHRVLTVQHSGPSARIGVLDFEGELQVRDPELFTAALAQGFGRAKAFGCGLMLVRRS